MKQNEIEEKTLSDCVEDEPQRKWYFTAIVWLWIATRATTLFVLDVSLWIIMTSTSAARASKPTRRVPFAMWFQSIAGEVLIFGFVFAAVFSGGLWLRANYKGLFHE